MFESLNPQSDGVPTQLLTTEETPIKNNAGVIRGNSRLTNYDIKQVLLPNNEKNYSSQNAGIAQETLETPVKR